MDQETIGKVADATGEVAKAGDTALKLAGKFGSYFSGALSTAGKMMDLELRFIAAKRGRRLSNKWRDLLQGRGQDAPTRHLPPNFVVPLLTAAVLEEDDELQDAWARLLVNAGDASTDIELRVAYVEVLRGMSSFDVKVLAKLAERVLTRPPGGIRAIDISTVFPEHGGTTNNDISAVIGISLSNLARLGCAYPGGGFDAAVIFRYMTLTDLGMALYRACSEPPSV